MRYFLSRLLTSLAFVALLSSLSIWADEKETAEPDHSETVKEEVEYPDPKRWEKTIAKFEAADRETTPPLGAVLAIGSSSMRGWHRKISDDLAPLTFIKRGFGGSGMQDVLYFMDRIVLPYKPRAILLYEGDNDAKWGVATPKIIATYREFIDRVHAELPETRIYILSVKPSIARWSIWPHMQEINAELQEICAANPLLTYIDISTPMLNEAGEPKPEIFVSDNLHMNRKGYELWRDAVCPVLISNEEAHEKKIN